MYFRGILFVLLLPSLSCVSKNAALTSESKPSTQPILPVDSQSVDCTKSRFTDEFRRDVFKRLEIEKELPGTWTVVDEETLKFEGKIANDSAKDFEEAMKKIKTLKNLILNSGGGSTRAGIAIGLRLSTIRPKVYVRGICASSCANYLYTAGSEKFIDYGWVGFHGNHASTAKNMTRSKLRTMLVDFYNKAQKSFVETEIDEQVEGALADFQKDLEPERKFLEAVGVQQDLFDIADREDKGTGLSVGFDFLVPTEATQTKFGISHVVGADAQDLCFLNERLRLAYY